MYKKLKWFFCIFLSLCLNFTAIWWVSKDHTSTKNTVVVSLNTASDFNTYSVQMSTTSLTNNTSPLQKQVTKQQIANNNANSPQNNRKPSSAKVIYKAQILDKTPMVYPKNALERSISGSVTLHILIDKNGTPIKVKIAKSSGFNILDVAATQAVKKWRFAAINNQEVDQPVWVEVPVQYQIDKNQEV